MPHAGLQAQPTDRQTKINDHTKLLYIIVTALATD